MVTNSTGEVVGRFDFDPFGVLLPGGIELGILRHRYMGREWDESLNLYYFRARSYDPATGRFLQRDPIATIEATSSYRAFRANPLEFSDPLGTTASHSGDWSLSSLWMTQVAFSPGLAIAATKINWHPDWHVDLDFDWKSSVKYASGVANAWASNQLGGIGRMRTWHDPNFLKGQDAGDLATLATSVAEASAAPAIGTGLGVALTPVTEGGSLALAGPLTGLVYGHAGMTATVASANLLRSSTDGHHSDPKYLGGAPKQTLARLKTPDHKEYHGILDSTLPRWVGKLFYDNLEPAAKQQVMFDLAQITKAFDAAKGTHLYELMVENGFPNLLP